MRDFSKVSPSVWDSTRFRELPNDEARYLYLYLLTSKHQSSAGAFGLPRGYALVDLGWEGQAFAAARDSLIAADMIQFDPATDEYRICRWFKHNPPQNAKHRIGITTTIYRLNSDLIREDALTELETLCPEPPTPPARRETLARNSSDLTSTGYFNGGGR